MLQNWVPAADVPAQLAPPQELQDDLEGLWLAVDEEVALAVLPGRGSLRLWVEHGGQKAVRVLGWGSIDSIEQILLEFLLEKPLEIRICFDSETRLNYTFFNIFLG